jgi:hypothetical protein
MLTKLLPAVATPLLPGGESARRLNRPSIQRILGMVSGAKIEAVAKLDRLTRGKNVSGKKLAMLTKPGYCLVAIQAGRTNHTKLVLSQRLARKQR